MTLSHLARPFMRPVLATSSRSVVETTLRSTVRQRHVRLLSSEVRSRIDGAVKSAPLVVFMKGTPELPQCGFSRAVCQILQVQGVEPSKIKTFNVLEDQELREGVKEYSSWPTIPQVYINGEFLGGCDIMLQSHQSGELEEQLAKEGLVAPEEGSKASAAT